MKEEELEQELENNKADMVFPTNEGYVKVENIERVKDVIISNSLRVSKIMEESELKGKTFKAKITIKDTVALILLLAEEEENPGSFSPVKSSPKQRIKYRNWNAIAKGRTGTVYEEVLNAFLEEYKEGEEPTPEISYRIIREMYGEELSKGSIAVYANMYKTYIKENKLGIKAPQEEDSVKTALDASIKSAEENIRQLNPKVKDLLPMDKVVEIWNLLPEDFKYARVKALVPAHIMQTASRIDTTNFIIKQFLNNPEFECEETSPGVFSKKGNGGEE